MYCPKCRSEYREGYTQCDECGVPLVAELPPEPEGKYVEWVTILTTMDDNAILVARSLLEDAGIPVFVEGEGLAHVVPMPTIARKLQVTPENVAQARLILNREGGFEADAE